MLAALTGIGLYLNGSLGVIIRNLKISKVLAAQGSAVTVQKAHSIWVDHCDLSSDPSQAADYGPLVSVTHGTDSVTITDNLFHDHGEAVQVGHSDDDAAEDKGKLRVTFARNHFKGVSSAISFRFGTGHILNSYFENVENGINTRMGADLLIEASVFEGTGKAIYSANSSETGFATVLNSDLGNGTNTAPAGTMTADSLPYPYDWYAWDTNTVKETAVKEAGQTLEFIVLDIN